MEALYRDKEFVSCYSYEELKEMYKSIPIVEGELSEEMSRKYYSKKIHSIYEFLEYLRKTLMPIAFNSDVEITNAILDLAIEFHGKASLCFLSGLTEENYIHIIENHIDCVPFLPEPPSKLLSVVIKKATDDKSMFKLQRWVDSASSRKEETKEYDYQ